MLRAIKSGHWASLVSHLLYYFYLCCTWIDNHHHNNKDKWFLCSKYYVACRTSTDSWWGQWMPGRCLYLKHGKIFINAAFTIYKNKYKNDNWKWFSLHQFNIIFFLFMPVFISFSSISAENFSNNKIRFVFIFFFVLFSGRLNLHSFLSDLCK